MAVDFSKSSLDYVLLIEFRWNGGASVRRYCRADQDLVVGGDTYTAMPVLDGELEPQRGDAQETGATITVALTCDPIINMITNVHAPVECTIREADRSDLATAVNDIFTGDIISTEARPRGKSDLVEVKLGTAKRLFTRVALGLVTSAECAWRFGDPHTCGFDLDAASDNALVEAIGGRTITLSGLGNAGDAGAGDGYYTNGIVSYQGLQLKVLEHKYQSASGSTADLVLVDAPPQGSPAGYTWLGQSVKASPGCPRTKAGCIYWGREVAFMAAGLLQPNYNPHFEDGSAS